MATHSSTLAWKISWMEETGWLQSKGLQTVRHDPVTSLHFVHFPCKGILEGCHKSDDSKPYSDICTRPAPGTCLACLVRTRSGAQHQRCQTRLHPSPHRPRGDVALRGGESCHSAEQRGWA